MVNKGDIKNLLDKMYGSASKKLDKRRSITVTSENTSEKYLTIPVVGGMLYIISRYSQAVKFNQQLDRDRMKVDTLRDNIKEEHSITNSIRRQLEEFQMEGGTVEITVKPAYQVYLKETLKEFPGIVCVDIGGGDFVMSSNDDI